MSLLRKRVSRTFMCNRDDSPSNLLFKSRFSACLILAFKISNEHFMDVLDKQPLQNELTNYVTYKTAKEKVFQHKKY